jgi:uncharacterized membrane protein YidH (DUF202 family)
MRQGLAVALIAGLGAQVLLGSFVHWYKGKTNKAVSPSGRGAFHYVHIGLGVVVVLIGWGTALTGKIRFMDEDRCTYQEVSFNNGLEDMEQAWVTLSWGGK